MEYDSATYQADRIVLGFTEGQRLNADMVRLKRKRLAMDGVDRDQASIDAASTRLLAWVASGAPEPLPPKQQARPSNKPAAPDLTQAAPPSEIEDAAWASMLAAQQERHKRRRAAYPHVRPSTPKPVKAKRRPKPSR